MIKENKEITTSEINNITIPEKFTPQINAIVKRMLDIETQYKYFKKMVNEMDDAIKNNTFAQWETNNPDAPIYPEAKKQRDVLQSERNNAYYSIKSTISNIVSEYYPDLHKRNLDYGNLNTSLMQDFKACLFVAYQKHEINELFSTISNILEEGRANELSDVQVQDLNRRYKEMIKILKAAHEEEQARNLYKQSNLKTIYFIEELNLKEAYQTLSFIGILNVDVITPILNAYSDAYEEFLLRYNFVNDYNKKLDDLRNYYISSYANIKK